MTGAHAITRRATSSPRFFATVIFSGVREATGTRSMSRASSRAIDARTAESLNISLSAAAEALAIAASTEIPRLSFAEFAAPYCAMLRTV
jgi:hypothetical protein